jgi:hypothetical protein
MFFFTESGRSKVSVLMAFSVAISLAGGPPAGQPGHQVGFQRFRFPVLAHAEDAESDDVAERVHPLALVKSVLVDAAAFRGNGNAPRLVSGG